MIQAKNHPKKVNRGHIADSDWEWRLVIGIILGFITGFIVGLHFIFNPLLG